MGRNHVYKMSSRVLTRILKRNSQEDEILCAANFCKKKIRAGDMVIARRNGKFLNSCIKVYHKKCWDKLFIEL